ncbi:MAG TPA: PEP-CTERM sorting domain-containing protein [Tepidisphaeraceae bacterium]|jgi:hypothetical protein|nr:PEP-CTERM sorting domain-containing protein [Tepidisphaeraceae bacterium]
MVRFLSWRADSAPVVKKFLGTLVLLGAAMPAAASPVTADLVVAYTPGNARADFQNSNAALGNLNGDTGFGAMNPFNPAFSSNDVVIVGEGGSLTLHLSSNVPTNGRNLGVYVNNGYVDTSATGTGLTDSGPNAFSAFPQAVVSVSQDGNTWYALSQQPQSFPVATNYYTDTEISGYFQSLGTQHASQSLPYLGTAGQLANSTYDQIKTAFNGSAGGNWLDLRGVPAPAINYVKFDVPAGAGRMVVDAIGGVGATNTLAKSAAILSEDVGMGNHTSDVVVDFGPQSYDFRVHYSTLNITGEQAIQLIQANSDLKYFAETFSFGDFVTGFSYGGYSLVGDGSGGSGFWKYDVSSDGLTWQSSGQGASSRLLTDGSYDGWLWSGADHANPIVPTAAPEPSSLAAVAVLSVGLLRRRRRVSGSPQ